MEKMVEQHKPDIFLSYSHKDRPWVSEFVAALEGEGIHSWFDMFALKPGEHWQEKIQDALRASKTLIVVLSNQTADSPWTFFEIGAAIADNKTIIPILTDENIDIETLPLALRPYQFLIEPSPQTAGKRVADVLEPS